MYIWRFIALDNGAVFPISFMVTSECFPMFADARRECYPYKSKYIKELDTSE